MIYLLILNSRHASRISHASLISYTYILEGCRSRAGDVVDGRFLYCPRVDGQQYLSSPGRQNILLRISQLISRTGSAISRLLDSQYRLARWFIIVYTFSHQKLQQIQLLLLCLSRHRLVVQIEPTSKHEKTKEDISRVANKSPRCRGSRAREKYDIVKNATSQVIIQIQNCTFLTVRWKYVALTKTRRKSVIFYLNFCSFSTTWNDSFVIVRNH